MILWIKAIGLGFLLSLVVDLCVALGMVTIPLLMVGWPVTWAVCAYFVHELLVNEQKGR